MEITLQHQGGAQFLAEARQHRVVTDQPAEDGATDHGMTPSELLLSALGSCIGQNVVQYLRLRKLPTDGLLIRVQAERTARPLHLADFRVEIVAPGLTERQLRAVEKALPTGLVHNAMIRETPVSITFSAMHTGDVTP
ncbi:MAG: OsmC family protein [Acidobacteriaceae bacterium]